MSEGKRVCMGVRAPKYDVKVDKKRSQGTCNGHVGKLALHHSRASCSAASWVWKEAN